MTELLKKDNFKWGPQADATSQALKPAMSRSPILALPDFSRPFIVETNTSSIGIGAVLVRDKHPLAFFSHALPQHARLKSVYEHELIAVVRAIQKWRHYLLGRKFIVRTDQRSLKFLLLQRMVSPNNQKWLSKLLGYDFEIECKPGFTNKVADALSRIPAQATLLALSTPQVLQLSELDKELASDPSLSQILATLYTGHPTKPGYSLVQGRLYYKNILVVPPQSNLISLILYDCHDSAIGGHSEVLKTLKCISAMFYWKGMKSDIQSYVAACPVCQHNKYSTLLPNGLLQPLPILQQIWEDLSLDFIEGLPKSEGWDTILVVVDRLSKYADFIRLKHPFTAAGVESGLCQELFSKTVANEVCFGSTGLSSEEGQKGNDIKLGEGDEIGETAAQVDGYSSINRYDDKSYSQHSPISISVFGRPLLLGGFSGQGVSPPDKTLVPFRAEATDDRDRGSPDTSFDVGVGYGGDGQEKMKCNSDLAEKWKYGRWESSCLVKFSEFLGFPTKGFENEIMNLLEKLVTSQTRGKEKGSQSVSKSERELRRLRSTVNYNGSKSNKEGGRDRGNLLLKLK